VNLSFELAPFLPFGFIIVFAACGIAAFIIARWRRVPDFKWRGILFLALAFLLLNPVVLNEVRKGLPDKLVIVMDDSASQKIGGRDAVAQKALEHLMKTPDVEPVVIHSGDGSAAGKGQSTNLFAALRNSLPGIPLAQAAGVVFVTDGQVHDVPAALGALEKLGPFHAVLTGKKDEFDRKVTVVSAPKYGLLSQDVKISVKVEEFGRPGGGAMPLSESQDGKKTRHGFPCARRGA
jgi:hypothetical protein